MFCRHEWKTRVDQWVIRDCVIEPIVIKKISLWVLMTCQKCGTQRNDCINFWSNPPADIQKLSTGNYDRNLHKQAHANGKTHRA